MYISAKPPTHQYMYRLAIECSLVWLYNVHAECPQGDKLVHFNKPTYKTCYN